MPGGLLPGQGAGAGEAINEIGMQEGGFTSSGSNVSDNSAWRLHARREPLAGCTGEIDHLVRQRQGDRRGDHRADGDSHRADQFPRIGVETEYRGQRDASHLADAGHSIWNRWGYLRPGAPDDRAPQDVQEQIGNMQVISHARNVRCC